MKLLRKSGLEESWQEGKRTHYQLSSSAREEAVKLLLALTAPDEENEGSFSV